MKTAKSSRTDNPRTTGNSARKSKATSRVSSTLASRVRTPYVIPGAALLGIGAFAATGSVMRAWIAHAARIVEQAFNLDTLFGIARLQRRRGLAVRMAPSTSAIGLGLVAGSAGALLVARRLARQPVPQQPRFERTEQPAATQAST